MGEIVWIVLGLAISLSVWFGYWDFVILLMLGGWIYTRVREKRREKKDLEEKRIQALMDEAEERMNYESMYRHY